MSRLMADPARFLSVGDDAVRKAQVELDKVEKFTENRLGSIKKNVHLRIFGEIGLDREFFTGSSLARVGFWLWRPHNEI